MSQRSPINATARDRAGTSGRARHNGGAGNSDRNRARRQEPGSHPSAQQMDVPQETTAPAIESFAELGLPDALLGALHARELTTPFPIQAATLPDALAGRDVLGRAQTGSGKTLAFGLALLTRLIGGKARPHRPRAIVLVPTRELAMQVSDELTPLAKAAKLWCGTAVGGMSFPRQADALRKGIDLLIATPGRLSDHMRQGTCVLSETAFVAVDEADRMSDMGFLPQVREILDETDENGQRLLFSATLDGEVSNLVKSYLTDPVTHSVRPNTASVGAMDHHVLLVSPQDKAGVITEVAARDGRTILFVRTKHHVDRLTTDLRKVGVRAAALHGGKTQGARNRVLGQFRDGSTPVLVATDVAARGIHVDGVSLVLHVDPPTDPKDYLHRAGRTARAGASGTVVTMATHSQRRTVGKLTERAGVRATSTKVAPGATDLARITGAQQPSGEPVVEREPQHSAGNGKRRPPRGRTGKPPQQKGEGGRPGHFGRSRPQRERQGGGGPHAGARGRTNRHGSERSDRVSR